MLSEPATAEDVVQDAYLKVMAGVHRINDSAKVLAYIRQTVVNGRPLAHASTAGGPAPWTFSTASTELVDNVLRRQSVRATGRAGDARGFAGLEQAQPDLAHRRIGGHRMPEPLDRHACDDRERGGV